MMSRTFIVALIGLIAMACQAQEYLPGLKYSREPAVLQGCVINDINHKAEGVKVVYLMKYHSGTGDARKVINATLDDNGCCSISLHTGTTVECQVMVGGYEFKCYVVPGDVTSFTFDLAKLEIGKMAEAVVFDGPLADFNRDLVYAREQGFDPSAIYLDINIKANANELVAELSEVSESGYYQYLDSTYCRINELIDADPVIGEAYREFAKAVNHYQYISAIPFCAYAIRYAGLDETEEAYEAFFGRQRELIERGLKEENWDSPALSYVMWHIPDLFLPSDLDPPVKLPEDYMQCYLASRYMTQIGKDAQFLSEAQIDSVRTYLPDLGQDVLDYNDKLEHEMALINEPGKSRKCTLPPDELIGNDILGAILEPYRGRPVLLDLWETTCGPCRMAFKQMHEKKLELADRIHFVSIASERSDLSTWERLIPTYVGDHYRLTEQQLQALHRQLSCDTNSVPLWVLVNADGSIHHIFTGWRNLDSMMKELEPALQ